MKNKKGAIITGLTSVFLYFGFVLLLLIFFLLFEVTKGDTEVKISGYIEDADVNYEVLNYLRMPVKFHFDGKEIDTNIADIIINYYLEDDIEKKRELQDLLKEKTNEIFNEKHRHLEWRIMITDKRVTKQMKDEKSEFAEAIASGLTTSEITKEKTLVKGMAIVCMLLPNPEFKKPIKVEFDFFNKASNAIQREKYQSLKVDKFNC